MSESKDKSEEPTTEEMSGANRVLNLLLGYAKLLALILLVGFAAASWKDLRALIPRISHLKALGVEVEMDQLESALLKQAESVKAPNVDLQPGQVEAVLARALKVHTVFQDAQILWIDDHPANNLPFRRLLRQLGADVEPARSTREALDLIAIEQFDLVVSDGKRGKEDGIAALAQLRAAGATCPAIFYVLNLNTKLPTPRGALGITNRPDDLLNLVIDGLERSRWTNVAKES